MCLMLEYQDREKFVVIDRRKFFGAKTGGLPKADLASGLGDRLALGYAGPVIGFAGLSLGVKLYVLLY